MIRVIIARATPTLNMLLLLLLLIFKVARYAVNRARSTGTGKYSTGQVYSILKKNKKKIKKKSK